MPFLPSPSQSHMQGAVKEHFMLISCPAVSCKRLSMEKPCSALFRIINAKLISEFFFVQFSFCLTKKQDPKTSPKPHVEPHYCKTSMPKMPKLRGRICDFRTFYVFNHVEANKEKVLCPIISFSLPANHLRCLSAPQRAPLCLVTSAVTAGGTSARAGFLARPVLRHVPIRELNLAVTPIKKKQTLAAFSFQITPPHPASSSRQSQQLSASAARTSSAF